MERKSKHTSDGLGIKCLRCGEKKGKQQKGVQMYDIMYSKLVKSLISNTPTQAEYHSQFGDEVIMFGVREILHKYICNHFVCWGVLNLDTFFLDMAMNEMMLDVYVLGSIAVPPTMCE